MKTLFNFVKKLQKPPLPETPVPSQPEALSPQQTSGSATPQNPQKQWMIAVGIILLFIAAALVIQFLQGTLKPKQVGAQYAQTFTLVNDSISKSAVIRINIPPDMKFGADEKPQVTFAPEIKGNFIESGDERVLAFQPSKNLDVGTYYEVALAGDGKTLRHQFLVAENPEVVTIFPKADVEAHESSEITIMFNRPMVPLTTLSELESKDVPVEITPATPGRFKWISTRNLQFIPENGLKKSAHYTVRVTDKLASLDGLSVKEVTHAFDTRNLRYASVGSGTNIFNQPIVIQFNQEVDLEKTKPQISLRDVTKNKNADIVIEYGTRIVKDEGGKELQETEKSAIFIFQHQDAHGRQKLFDFNNTYELRIAKAFPENGDIILDEERTQVVHIPDIIESVTAESPVSDDVNKDFFDPAGTLWVRFYEAVDLSKSEIKQKDIANTRYGKNCKKPEEYLPDCEQEDDRALVGMTFNAGSIAKGERFDVLLEKIMNDAGLTLNPKPIPVSVTAVPELVIYRTAPGNQSQGANLRSLTICSNNPLVKANDETVGSSLQSSPEYYFRDWSDSYRVTYAQPGDPCQNDEFETRIAYGLKPLADYSMTLRAKDPFGSSGEHSFSFQTRDFNREDLSFYHYQPRFTVTRPENMTLTYAVENMTYVDVNICRLSAERMLYWVNRQPSYTQSPSAIPDCLETITRRIELEPKYWTRNFFELNLASFIPEEKRLGQYLVTISHPTYRDYRGRQIFERNYLSVTNLSLAEKRLNRYDLSPENEKELATHIKDIRDLYWVTDTRTLKPVQGASLAFYQGTPEGWGEERTFTMKNAGSASTDAQGIARTASHPTFVGAIATSGNDSAVLTREDHSLQWADSAYPSERMFLYTDRPIYRPGQTVFVKGWHRIGYNGAYDILNGQSMALVVRSSDYEELYTETVTLNDFGAFDATFDIPTDAPLGYYTICVEESSCDTIDVQEFVPAAFKVDARSDKEEYISGDTVTLTVDSDYYFGVPLEAGSEVEYVIVSQSYYFDRFEDEYFAFGRPWYFCYEDCDFNDRFEKRGLITLNGQGEATITEQMNFAELFPKETDRTSRIMTAYVTVTNPNGQQITAEKSFIIHAGEFYAGVKTDPSFVAKDEPFTIRVKTVDTQGKEMSVKNVNLKIQKIGWVQHKRQEVDGAFYNRYELVRKTIYETNVDMDKNGNASLDYRLPEEGQYDISLSGTDSRGNIVGALSTLYVYGDGEASVRATNDTSLELAVEKTELKVGDTGSIIIKSPYKRALALIAIERGKIYEYEIKELTGNLHQFTFHVKEEYTPNVTVSVFLLSDKPDIKFGSQNFTIDREKKNLNVAITTSKQQYLPGEEVVVDVVARDSEGRPVSAELSLAVADLSVLALKGNPKENPVVFFYDGFPLTISTESNLKYILQKIEIKPGKGGGGGDLSELGKKKRGEFKDTAYWLPAIRTDENGRAQTKFTLPDNLTTWQVESLGITQDTKVGAGYSEFRAKKDLMVVPLKPHFIVPGDSFMIGAQVFNQTDKKLRIDLSLETETLAITGDAKEKLTLDAGQNQTLYFAVKAPEQKETGVHRFTLSAKGNGFEDTVEQTIPITRNNTFETTATANATKEDHANEFVFVPGNVIADKGELTVRSNATLANFLTDALGEMIEFPYGSTEQLGSTLSVIATLKRASQIPNIGADFELNAIKKGDETYTADQVVSMTLPKIYERQISDGGFVYYSGYSGAEYANFHLTLHIVNVLKDLEAAGYAVDASVLNRAEQFLVNHIREMRKHGSDPKDLIILTAYTIGRGAQSLAMPPLKSEITAILADKEFINEKISSLSLAHLAMVVSNGYDKRIQKRIFDQLESRVTIDARGAFLPHKGNLIWQYYETPIKDTAFLVKAFAETQNDHPLLPNLVRWMISSRDKTGVWGSTNNTMSVVGALTDFLVWQRETDANYDLAITVGDEMRETLKFRPENVFEGALLEYPIKDLPKDRILPVSFDRTRFTDRATNFYYDMTLRYFLPADKIPPRDEGFTIEQAYYRLDDKKFKEPVSSANVGELLRGRLKISVPQGRNFVAIEDVIPAGVELVNFGLNTENPLLRDEPDPYEPWFEFDPVKGVTLMPDFEEVHDDRLYLYTERMPEGVYEFDYIIRALIPGVYTDMPARVSELYFPENFGRTAGKFFEVTE